MTKLYSTLNWNEIHELAVAQVGKPAVYVANHGDATDEQLRVVNNVRKRIEEFGKKLPDGTDIFDLQHVTICDGLVFFETMELANEFFSFFCTEDTDSSFLYAVLYRADGKCINENT